MLRVAVTNTAMYNEGRLHCKWIELPASSEEEIEQVLKEVLRPGDEEVFISDYECDYPIKVDQYSRLDKLNDLADQLLEYENEHGKHVLEALMHAVDTSDIDNVLQLLEDQSFDVIEDVKDPSDVGAYLVQTYITDPLPSLIASHIDYDSLGRDWLDNHGGHISIEHRIAVVLN